MPGPYARQGQGVAWVFLVAIVFFIVVFLGGCQRQARIHHTQGNVFGTLVEISIYGKPEAEAAALSAAVLREFDRLHHKFHAWQPSDLTALNEHIARGVPYDADEEMVAILRAAKELADSSDNLFNPAVGHLIRLWGFQSSSLDAQKPSAAEIRKWVAADPKMADLRFDGTRIRSVNPAVMLDLGGYAKGYALDRAAAILRAAKVKGALINVGGNMLAIGAPGDRPWKVGIKNPRGDGAFAAVELHDNEAIGTSGDYQRYYMQDGKRRPHIIDPRSGESIDVMASVTIITSGGSDAGTRSDGKSKPLFLAGPGLWQAMAERLGLREVLVVDTKGAVAMTEAMRKRLILPEKSL